MFVISNRLVIRSFTSPMFITLFSTNKSLQDICTTGQEKKRSRKLTSVDAQSSQLSTDYYLAIRSPPSVSTENSEPPDSQQRRHFTGRFASFT